MKKLFVSAVFPILLAIAGPVSAQEVISTPLLTVNSGADNYSHLVRFSKTDNTFVVRGVGNYLQKYDLSNGNLLGQCCQVEFQYHSMDISPDGKYFAGGPRQTGYNIQLANYEPLSFWKTLSGHSHRVYATAFLPDNKRLLSGSFHGEETFLWDIASGQRIWSQSVGQWENHVVSPDGTLFAQSNRSDVQIRRISDGSLIRTLNHQSYDSAWGAQVKQWFSADGTQLVSVGSLGDIKLWDVASGNLLGTWREGGRVYNIRFLGDGIHIVTVNSSLGGARLWNLQIGQIEKIFSSGSNTWDLDVSPDEMYLLTNAGGVVRYWRLFDQPYDTTAPSSPLGVIYSTQGSDVLISWQPASDPQSGVKFYRIYRGSSGAETYYTQVGAITSWIDTAAAGNGYSYKVTAVNGNGQESPLTSQDPMPTLTPTQSIPTPTPTPSPACRADVNGNRTVEIGDISGILFYWGASCAANMSACIADVNGNSTVEIGDIAGTLFYWGQSCP